MSHLKEKFNTTIKQNLFKELSLKSISEVPKLEKIVINVGVGDATKDKDYLKSSVKEIELITNQKPIVTKAKNSIAAFKLREGQSIGVKVTLRNKNMWNFLSKLISIAIPRIRDFRGLNPNAFDGRGNFTMGIKEQIIFTEVHYDNVKKIRGMDITLVTSTNHDDHAYALLKSLGLPFKVKKS